MFEESLERRDATQESQLIYFSLILIVRFIDSSQHATSPYNIDYCIKTKDNIHMRVREFVLLPRLAAAAPFEKLPSLAADVNRDAFAGEGEPIALLGLQAIAAAWEFAT